MFVLLLVSTMSVLYGQIPDSLFPKKPDPPRLVNDFTATLSAPEKQWLEDKLVEFDKTSSNQVSIVMVQTIADHAPAVYATELGRRWGIGQKDRNNGVLILLVMQSHDVFIAPGYGLEGALPDLLCKQVIENEMLPSFKQGYFYEGLDKATTVIMQASRGEFSASGPYEKKWSMPRWLIILLLIVGINGFFLIVIPLLRRLYYWIIGKKPPKLKHHEWANTPAVTDTSADEPAKESSSDDTDDFGGFDGGSFGGAGAGGKW